MFRSLLAVVFISYQASGNPLHFSLWPKTFHSAWYSGPSLISAPYESFRSQNSLRNGYENLWRTDIRSPPLQPDLSNSNYGVSSSQQHNHHHQQQQQFQHQQSSSQSSSQSYEMSSQNQQSSSFGSTQHQNQNVAPVIGIPQNQNHNPAPVYGPPGQQQNQIHTPVFGIPQQQQNQISTPIYSPSQEQIHHPVPIYGLPQNPQQPSTPIFNFPLQPQLQQQQPAYLYGQQQQFQQPMQSPLFGLTSILQSGFNALQLPSSAFSQVLPLIPRPGAALFIPRQDLSLPAPNYLPPIASPSPRPMVHLAIHDTTPDTIDSAANGNQQISSLFDLSKETTINPPKVLMESAQLKTKKLIRTTTEPSATATTEEIFSSTFYDSSEVATNTTTEPEEIATTEQNDENNTIL